MANLISVKDVAQEFQDSDILAIVENDQCSSEITSHDLAAIIDLHEPFLNPVIEPEIQSFLDKLSAADWFAKLADQTSEDVLVVTEYKPTKTLGYICIAIQNEIIGYLIDKMDCHYASLTPLFARLNNSLDVLMDKQLHNIPQATPDFDPADVRALILHACLEIRYPAVSSNFAVECCNWLLSGKIPIGWDGEFPNGNLVVT